MTLVLTVPSIECDGCAASIQRSLGKLAGVQSVAVGVTEKRVTIDFDETLLGEESIRTRLEAAGFEALLA